MNRLADTENMHSLHTFYTGNCFVSWQICITPMQSKEAAFDVRQFIYGSTWFIEKKPKFCRKYDGQANDTNCTK